MLSPMERMFYLDILRVSPGLVAQYYDPMTRALNIVLIPAAVGIMLLLLMTEPLKRKFGKGMQAIFMVVAVVFMITNGLYAAWAELATTWTFLFIGIGVISFVLESFISKSFIKNLASHASHGFKVGQARRMAHMNRKVYAMEDELGKLELQARQMDEMISMYQNEIINETAILSNPGTSPAERARARRRIDELRRKIESLRLERMKLSRRHRELEAERNRLARDVHTIYNRLKE